MEVVAGGCISISSSSPLLSVCCRESLQMWIYSYNELTDLVELMWKLMIPSTAYNVVNTVNIWTWSGDKLNFRLQQLNSFGQYFINHSVYALLVSFQIILHFKYFISKAIIAISFEFILIFRIPIHSCVLIRWRKEEWVTLSKCMGNFFLIP